MSTRFQAEQYFDSTKKRQYVNNKVSVLHCHHYASLFSQLADDAKLFNGSQLLFESAEECFYPVLKNYFDEHKIDSQEDKIAIAEDYFGFIGLGKVAITMNGSSGSVEMVNSHVDEGWIKKWSTRDKPVNFIGQGFLAGAFAAIKGEKPASYKVTETQSIVSNSPSSQFTIVKKEEV